MMQTMQGRSCLALASVIIGISWGVMAQAAEQVLVQSPELVIKRSGATQTCAFPASGYSGYKLEGTTASLTLDGQELPAGNRKVLGGGVSEISWTPGRDSTEVVIHFAAAPQSSLLNAVPGTLDRPHTSQVLAGFIFPGGALAESSSGLKTALGARGATDNRDGEQAGPRDAQAGSYKLPTFPATHYSDALVSLRVENADFRDILFLMGRIGNVSIMLDPYFDDEPTGSKRAGKGGGVGGSGQGSGQQGGSNGLPGQGPGNLPNNGTGYVTLNFTDVPFDQALDLLLQSAGLVKTDVYPNH